MSRIFDFVRTLTARVGAGRSVDRPSDQPATQTEGRQEPATTLATGEEGEDPGFDSTTDTPITTTLAIGEEGEDPGFGDIADIAPPSPAGPTPTPYPNEATTLAIGEEGEDPGFGTGSFEPAPESDQPSGTTGLERIDSLDEAFDEIDEALDRPLPAFPDVDDDLAGLGAPTTEASSMHELQESPSMDQRFDEIDEGTIE